MAVLQDLSREKDSVATDTATVLDILVVGGGLAGLTVTIETKRKGHRVRIIESRSSFTDHGDLIAIQTPALHTPQKWPGFMDNLVTASFEPWTHMCKYDGTFIGKVPLGSSETPSLAFNRNGLRDALYEYCRSMEVFVEFNAKVTDYYEATDTGGVVLSDGKKLEADLIVAADRVGSKSCAFADLRWTLKYGVHAMCSFLDLSIRS